MNFSYTLHPSLEPETEKRTSEQPKDRTSLISHPSTSGTLVLGHTSLLTTFLLSHDEKYILTADRDEHIRVSWYPQGYCIESYCLGSTKFVSGFSNRISMLTRISDSYQLSIFQSLSRLY